MLDDVPVMCIGCIQLCDGRRTGLYENPELYASYVVPDVTPKG